MVSLPWYKPVENFLLEYGSWVVVPSLMIIGLVSLYFAWSIIVDKQNAIAGTAWLVYMIMP